MEAFQAAVDLGYRYLETDVHLTADSVVVAFHDSVLDRVTDRTGPIGQARWEEVAAARIAGTGTIPSLDELLDAFPRARLNIDPKSDEVLEPLLDRLRARGAIDRVCIGSFSDRRLRRARLLAGPGLCTGLGPREVAALRAASIGLPIASGRSSAGACVQVPPAARGVPIVTERFVDEAHRRGLVVHVWTIDDPAEMGRLLDLGVDGIMTDRPEILRDVLRQRGAWVEPG